MIYLPLFVQSVPITSIYPQNFFKFCIHIVIGDAFSGIVNGQNLYIYDRVTALFLLETSFWPIIPLLFMINE